MMPTTERVAHAMPGLLWRSARNLVSDDGPQWAAVIAYYALLSTFPLVIAGMTLAGFITDPEWAIRHVVELMGDFLPEGEQEVESIIEDAANAHGRIGLIAFVGLLWSGTRVFMALTRSVNVAFDVDDEYGFLHRLAVEVAMLFTVGLFFVLALLSGYLTRAARDALSFVPGNDGALYDIGAYLVRALALLLAFYLIYRFVPRGNHPRAAALTGAVVATVLFSVASPLFRYWVTEFGAQDLIYGRMAMLIVVLLWVWVVSIITLFGGEVAAEAEATLLGGERQRERRRQGSRNRMGHTRSRAATD